MTKRIELARKIFKKEFEEDESFKETYIANIEMLLYDRYGMNNHEKRNRAALDIMDVIFDAKELKKKRFIKEKKVDRFEIMDI